MSWQTKVVVRILFLLAGIFAEDESLKRELQTLATHVQASTAK